MQKSPSAINTKTVPMKYVGFCDILGFSSAVLKDFDATLELYQKFRKKLQEWPFPLNAKISLYSDSILIIGDELPPVLDAIISLQWAAMEQGWLMRGGIAYGRYWEETENGNLFVVSDALIRAAAIEKSIKVPAIAICEELLLGIEAWIPRFKDGIFKAPLLYFRELTIVNPFNRYWFKNSIIKAQNLLDEHPGHKEKYEWFLSLADAVAQDELLVPESALTRMLELGILQDRAEI